MLIQSDLLPPANTNCGPKKKKTQLGPPTLDQPFLIGSVHASEGEIPKVSSSLQWRDQWGSFKARWGVGRMNYTIDPGLYALGNPDEQTLVFVTANYKMSFDRLRQSLAGLNAWILVLDTQGINVWCAAGKGTFGTEELIQQIESSNLSDIVTHRNLILPQLSGPGVAAYQINKLSGFKVTYGPIRASDLPAFLDAGLKATPEMRLKTFDIGERTVLVPMELVSALKVCVIIVPLILIICGLLGPQGFWSNVSDYGLSAVLYLFIALIAGAVLTPLLLPWLPGRAFSFKGMIMGLITVLALWAFEWDVTRPWGISLEIGAWALLIPAISAYLAMNFTGASTYTSLSGVKKEIRLAVPLEIGAGLAGLILWLSFLLTV